MVRRFNIRVLWPELCGPLSSEDQLIDMAKETMPASSCGFFAATRLKIIRANDSGAASHTPALSSCNPSQRAFRPNVVLNSHANGHLRLKRCLFAPVTQRGIIMCAVICCSDKPVLLQVYYVKSCLQGILILNGLSEKMGGIFCETP